MSKQGKIIAVICGMLVIVGVCVAQAAAADADLGSTQTPAEKPDLSFLDDPNFSGEDLGFGNRELWGKMMSSVALVIVLAVAAFYLSRKVLPKVSRGSGKEIHILETTYLGPRKALHLVEVGKQKLLIGSTNESIATLAHVTDAWLDLSKQEIDDTVEA